MFTSEKTFATSFFFPVEMISTYYEEVFINASSVVAVFKSKDDLDSVRILLSTGTEIKTNLSYDEVLNRMSKHVSED